MQPGRAWESGRALLYAAAALFDADFVGVARDLVYGGFRPADGHRSAMDAAARRGDWCKVEATTTLRHNQHAELVADRGELVGRAAILSERGRAPQLVAVSATSSTTSTSSLTQSTSPR